MAQAAFIPPTAVSHTGGPIITVPVPSRAPPPHIHHVYMHTTETGRIAFWVFFGVFMAGLSGVAILAMRVERRSRVFHALSGLALAITATSYLMLATGLGMSPPPWQAGGPPHARPPPHRHGDHGKDYGAVPPVIPPEPPRPTQYIYHRQRIWSRDFEHTLTAPLFFIQLAILCGMAPLAGVVASLAAGFATFSNAVANGFARRTRMPLKWVAWDIVATLWTAVAFAYLLIPGGTAARHRAPKTRSRFFLATVLLFLAYANYGIMSLLGPALQIASVDVEVIVLGITDVAAQLGFTFFLLFTHVHDDEDPTWTFPAWFAEPRGGADGRGNYDRVPESAAA